MDYFQKYIKYKTKYNSLKKEKQLNINNHKKKSFIDLNIKPDFNFGQKNTQSILIPHAGSFFIKSILDYVFSDIKKDFEEIVLLTTNHNTNNNYILNVDNIIYNKANPKINIKVNKINTLEEIYNSKHFYTEHSYLSVLPYLNMFNIPVTIISVNIYSDDLVEKIIKYINNRKILLIANTDLLHCGSNYGNLCPENIEAFNAHILRDILSNNIHTEKFNKMCGISCVKTFLKLLNILNLQYTEHLITSSDIVSEEVDKLNSVGYGAILFNKTGKPDIKNNTYLSNIPKSTIDTYFTDKLAKYKFKLFIKDVEGIFVTIYSQLNQNNNLRGCIGTFKLKGDILNTIQQQTLLSAFEDTRFKPVLQEELPHLTYKINYLQTPFEVTQDKLFEIYIPNVHGITIEFSDNSSATYLASVMPEAFDINTKEDFRMNFKMLIHSLREKSNSSTDSKIQKIKLYVCEEY
jgi:AmmeMemoRadiSam system protein B